MAGEEETVKSHRVERVRWLSAVADVERAELRSLGRFFLLAFLLLAAYYIVRALREALILTDFGAEARSMAVGVAAASLIIIVPLYARLRHWLGANRLIMWIYTFFLAALIGFFFAWKAGYHIGFVFFVWVGLFGLMVVSQFWALANGSWNEYAGKRLFPVIMIGANLGALVGTEVAAIASQTLGTRGLMLIGCSLLLMGTLMVPGMGRHVPPRSLAKPVTKGLKPKLLGGFGVIARDRYLLLMAVMVVLLNWVNSTGEYLFAHFVEMHALAELPAGASAEMRANYITGVYSKFMLWYTTLGLLAQTFLVSRLFRWLGVGWSAIILPAFVAASYLLIAFVPIFSIIRWVKVAENAMDYSLMGTVRHALFLPTNNRAKFDGKTAIDTFFWRLGDLIQAGTVWAGVHYFQWEVREFAFMAAGIAVLFLLVTIALAREYRRRVPDDGLNLPHPIQIIPGQPVDAPFGDLVDEHGMGGLGSVSAHVDDGTPLPIWLSFDWESRRFRGQTPADLDQILHLRLVGEDEDEQSLEVPVSLVPVRTE